jgi:YfiH family protein
MWLQAPNIACTHGFSDRYGGISSAPFDTLNLGGSEDDPAKIDQNRRLALGDLNLEQAGLCYLKQVHGNQVNIASPGRQEGDALVTNKKGLILAISVADCFPLLFFDGFSKIIGAAHAGWRGTLALIAENTIRAMEQLGGHPRNIQVAIGQGICYDKFNVGREVTEQFETAGFPKKLLTNGKIDLAGCNMHVMTRCGIPPENIWHMNRCTFENDFYSYRRDKGVTGRMWGVIAL